MPAESRGVSSNLDEETSCEYGQSKLAHNIDRDLGSDARFDNAEWGVLRIWITTRLKSRRRK